MDQRLHSLPVDGGKIIWIHLPPEISQPPQGTVLISPGRTESWVNWAEVAARLSDWGYHVALLEHRGQGRSQRFFQNQDKGHIDQFETYVKDFNLFQEEVTAKRLPKPYFLVGNSMGAAIALLADTKSLSKMALYAPMFKIQTGHIPYPVAKVLVKILRWMGLGDAYALGTGPFSPRPFEENDYASSRRRYEIDIERSVSHPEMIVGGPTIQWVHEAFRVPDLLRGRSSQLQQPILILQADDERFVDNQIQDEICAQIRHCVLRRISGSKHVLHLEDDENFNRMIQLTIGFFQAAEIDRSSSE